MMLLYCCRCRTTGGAIQTASTLAALLVMRAQILSYMYGSYSCTPTVHSMLPVQNCDLRGAVVGAKCKAQCAFVHTTANEDPLLHSHGRLLEPSIHTDY